MNQSILYAVSEETALYRLASKLGLVGLMLFAFFAFLGTAGAYIGLGLMLVAIIISIPQVWPVVKRDPMCLVVFFGIAYVLTRSSFVSADTPDWNSLNYELTWDWVRLSLFLIIAWFLGGSLRRVKWFLLLSLSGLLLGVAMNTDWEVLWPLIGTTHRDGFGWGINTFGLFSMSVLLGLLVMGPRLLGEIRGRRLAFIASIGGWLFLVVAMLQMSLQTGTKGAWLAGLIVIIGVLILLAWKGFRDGLTSATIVGLVLVGAMFTTIALNADSIGQRLSVEDELELIFSRDALESSAPSSMVGRAYMLLLGGEAWSQSPLFGMGAAASKELIANASNERMRIMSHLHNMYLEVLVAWGLVGALVAATVLVLLFRTLWISNRQGILPLDYALLNGVLIVVWLLWGVTEYRLAHVDGMFHWYLIAGLGYTMRFHRREKVIQIQKEDKVLCVE